MKRFEMTHNFFNTSIQFDEDSPPWWLVARGYKWLWDGHVLTLDIGNEVIGDFQTIKRIE